MRKIRRTYVIIKILVLAAIFKNRKYTTLLYDAHLRYEKFLTMWKFCGKNSVDKETGKKIKYKWNEKDRLVRDYSA